MGLLLGLVGAGGILLAAGCAVLWNLPRIEQINAQTAQADQKIVAIINQPITHLPRSGPVSVFSPGWFHEGAIKPDFNTVDIRATQEFPYDGHVTSDVTPSEMFIGSELEFNAMTKYFYVDRNLPKKRLSSGEMVEINGLYRVLGQDEQAMTMQWLMLAGLALLAICLGAALPIAVRRNGLSAG
ncbi:hypothetical protein FJ987_17875 [Mesorhizobium sp. CU2]|uniref:hypothetical protein n=1 Tax=unclassified Mesorhizobium TaxID=325217 RepID=UPI0011281B40|nr:MULTISPECIES: hypothetical protein [unclassified Mesorhizobium]TPN76761.1 hypothetical protein FJ988_27850 [Mesorhizobium sp. CU3]TPO11734.1 hypothetical protein FJ987_17875 [Mesorhizobium sp. CU2]